MNRKLTIALLLTIVAMIGMPEVLAIDVENPVSVGGPNGVNIAPGTISVGGPSGVNIPTTTTQPMMTEIPTITAAPTTSIVPPISAPATAPSTNPFAAAFGAPSGEVARQRLEQTRQLELQCANDANFRAAHPEECAIALPGLSTAILAAENKKPISVTPGELLPTGFQLVPTLPGIAAKNP